MSATTRQKVLVHMATEVVAGASLPRQVASYRIHAKPHTMEVPHGRPKGQSEHADEKACEPHHQSSCRKATRQPTRMATMEVAAATRQDAQAPVSQEIVERCQAQHRETRMQLA